MKKSMLLFISGALLADALQAVAYFADLRLDGLGWVSIGVKTLLILACLLVLRRMGTGAGFPAPHPRRRWGLILCCVLAVQFAAQVRPLNARPAPLVLAAALLGVLTTALWEELYFRAVAVRLFRGELNRRTVGGMCLIFALSHMVNAITGNWVDTGLTVFFAFGMGMLLLGLYAASGRLVLPMLAHFCVNGISVFFNCFSSLSPAIGGFSLILYPLFSVLCALFGYALLFPRGKPQRG